MNDDRIDAGLLHQHDVLRELRRQAVVHGVAAVLHHDGLVVVGEDEGQRFDEHARGLPPPGQIAQVACCLVVNVHAGPRDGMRWRRLYRKRGAVTKSVQNAAL